MTTDAIRNTIELAKLHEQQSGYLTALFEQSTANSIHLAIQLPANNAATCLVDFVISYIEYVPCCIDTVRLISEEAGIDQFAEPFLNLAVDFFLKPPEATRERTGLNELMDEAYLAHRLIEEMNDQFMVNTSIALVPIDMSISNLIVHSLIGEPFANELDEAVHYTAEKAMAGKSIYNSPQLHEYVAVQKRINGGQTPYRPCLTDQFAINLQFP
ncbi:MAG: hypothetical protein V7459_14925 [Oceanicoccus sp.]